MTEEALLSYGGSQSIGNRSP